MSTIGLADLVKKKVVHKGLQEQNDRTKFMEGLSIGQDGLYVTYLTDFFDIMYRKEKFSRVGQSLLKGSDIPEMESVVKVREKIPSAVIHQMVAWYRHVTFEYGTEATMQVFYDKSEGENDFPQELKDKYEGAIKRDGKFVYVIPVQNVTGGFVSFDGEHFPQGLNKELYEWALSNYEPILNIHSHNSMGAFWSGTDDANELPLYNRLCLVIGKLDTDHPEFRFSWNFDGKRHHYEEGIDSFIEPIEMTTTVNGLGYEETEELGFNDALRHIDYDKVNFDELWDNQLRARGLRGLNRGKYVKVHNLDSSEYLPSKEDEARIQQGLEEGTITDEDLDDIYAELSNDLTSGLDNVMTLEDDYSDLSSIDEFGGADDGITLFDEDWKKDLQRAKNNLATKEEPKKKKPLYTPSKDFNKGVVNKGHSTSETFRKQGKRDNKGRGGLYKSHKKEELKKGRRKFR